MLPSGIEFRPELSSGGEVLAFGFSGEQVDSDRAFAFLTTDLIDYIATETTPLPRTVIVDMRNVNFLNSVANGKLSSLRKRLAQLNCEWVLVLAPGIRDTFGLTNLDKLLKVVTIQELGQLRSSRTDFLDTPQPLNGELPIDFTQEELDEMISDNITLEDAIREIEKLRR
jgi:anti-anti-sigma regulatory factor